jgi:SNF2 family DNA or RNA helicase
VLKPYPYQEEGAAWLASGLRRGLADDAGLGKTPQAILAAGRAGATRIRVACPAIARVVWERHVEQWRETAGLPENLDLEVKSYDALALDGDLRRRWARSRPDVLICDEAHYLKTRGARRTRAIYGTGCKGTKGISAACGATWLLTATPTPNHPGELWSHLRALRPDLIRRAGGPMDYNTFIEYFCHLRATEFGPIPYRLKRPDEIRALAKELFLRRRWQEVLTDLPDWTWASVPIEATDTLEALKTWEREHPEVGELVAEMEREGVQGPPAAHIASYRHWVGCVKAPVVAEQLAEELRNGEMDKVVVFAHHHDVLNALHSVLYPFNPVQVTGNTSPTARTAAMDRFQCDPSCRVFLGQVQACGVAVTLHASRHVVFVEPEWVPADMYQAAKRVHRIGQGRPVYVRVFGLAGSLDDRTAAACARKAQMTAAIFEKAA